MMKLKAGFSDKINSDYSIFITFPYNPNYLELIKSLRIRAWNNNTKEWEVPYSLYSDLITMLNNNGVPYDGQGFMRSIQELSQMVDQMQTIQKVDANVDASVLDDVEFKTNPFIYQREGIAYGLNNDKFLLADSPGLGKTIQSTNIARLKRGGNHCLVVVGYKSLLFNWVREIELHTQERGYVLGQRTNKRGKLVTGKLQDRLDDLRKLDQIEEFFIITDITTLRQCEKEEYKKKNGKKGVNKTFFFADLIEYWCKRGEIGRVILDESHVFKGYETDQTQALLRIKNCPYKIAMTGTPIMNKNIDLYPIMHWLGYETRDYWAFRERYCKLGGYKGKQIVGDKNNPELHHRLKQFMLRRLKDDVLDLPEKIIIDEYLEMDGQQWALYDKTRRAYQALLAQAEAQGRVNKFELLSQNINLRKITCHPGWYEEGYKLSVKYERILQIIEEAVSNGQKSIVYSNFTTPFDSTDEYVNIYNMLKQYNPAMIVGDTKDRMSEIEKFQTDPTCMVMVGSIGAMGVGITLTAASNVIFIDEPWNQAIKDQAIDRAHRVGTKDSVNVYTLICKDTVDEGVHKLVNKKGRLASEIVDGVSTDELVGLLKDY